MIRLERLEWRREERHIIRGVDLTVQPGEHWVILGRNGSGKTSILEMIMGYLFPTSGHVTVLGQRYGTVDVREVRKRIGYMSQSLIEKLALADPVWEVVATGEYGYLRFYQQIDSSVERKARAIISELGISRLADQPLGTLSQGERKKVLLARALMAEPELLIMDEPCAGLDLFEREKLLAELGPLSRRKLSVIYVTHHLEEIVPLFTHVALLHEGTVCAAGPKERVLTRDNLSLAYGLPIDIKWEYDRPWIRLPIMEAEG